MRALQTIGSMKRVLACLAGVAFLTALPAAVLGGTDEIYLGVFSGAAEVPQVSSNGRGTAYVSIDPTDTRITYALNWTGLSAPVTAVSLRADGPGSNGLLIAALPAGPGTIFGSLSEADFQPPSSSTAWAAVLTLLRTGRAYITLQTATHPQGEVRAQLVRGAVGLTPTASLAPTGSGPGFGVGVGVPTTPGASDGATGTPATPAPTLSVLSATSPPTRVGAGALVGSDAPSSPGAPVGVGGGVGPAPATGAGFGIGAGIGPGGNSVAPATTSAAATAAPAPLNQPVAVNPVAAPRDPPSRGGSAGLLALLVLVIGAIGGIVATAQVRPQGRTSAA